LGIGLWTGSIAVISEWRVVIVVIVFQSPVDLFGVLAYLRLVLRLLAAG